MTFHESSSLFSLPHRRAAIPLLRSPYCTCMLICFCNLTYPLPETTEEWNLLSHLEMHLTCDR